MEPWNYFFISNCSSTHRLLPKNSSSKSQFCYFETFLCSTQVLKTYFVWVYVEHQLPKRSFQHAILTPIWKRITKNSVIDWCVVVYTVNTFQFGNCFSAAHHTECRSWNRIECWFWDGDMFMMKSGWLAGREPAQIVRLIFGKVFLYKQKTLYTNIVPKKVCWIVNCEIISNVDATKQ